jgi:hypothetical protein
MPMLRKAGAPIFQHQCLGSALVNPNSMNHQAQIDQNGPQNHETTMLMTIPNSPGTNANQKAWIMLTRGFRTNGKLSHELVQSAMVKFNYKSPRYIHCQIK